MIRLRDYQNQCADDIRQAYRSGYKRPLLVLPTGGGKTTIFSYITANASAKNNSVLLLVHRAELVKQVSMTLAKFAVSHDVIAPAAVGRQCMVEQFKEMGRHYVDKTSRVAVASVQTLIKRLDTCDPDVIIVDECHHATLASTWGKIIAHYDRARCLLVTATPCRLDGKGLGVDDGGYADALINGPTMRWLIDNRYLCDYRVFAPPSAVDLNGVRSKMGDFAKNQLADAMDKPTITGDAVEHYQSLCAGKRAIVFCVSIKHAQHVAEQFQAAGIASGVLDGTMDAGARDKQIKEFAAGECLVLCSCDVVSEGFDLPAIEAAILLRPTQSLSLYLQQVGRALRTFPGKDQAIILDHVGNVARHGLPDDDREWTLEGVKKRERQRDDDAPAVSIRTCKECFSVHPPANNCPYCGYVYPEKSRKVEQTAGNLVELTAAARAEMRKKRDEEKLIERAARIVEERHCRTLDDFIALGQSRGYKFPKQWAEKRFSFRQKRI